MQPDFQSFADELEKIASIKNLFVRDFLEDAKDLTSEEKEKLKDKLPAYARYAPGAVPMGVLVGGLAERAISPELHKRWPKTFPKPSSTAGMLATMAAMGLGYHLGTSGKGHERRVSKYYKKQLEKIAKLPSVFRRAKDATSVAERMHGRRWSDVESVVERVHAASLGKGLVHRTRKNPYLSPGYVRASKALARDIREGAREASRRALKKRERVRGVLRPIPG